MPATRVERLLAWSGVVLLACLFVLTVVAWRDYSDVTPAPEAPFASPEQTPPPAPRAVAVAPARATQPSPLSTSSKNSRRASAADTIALHAARGDCWLEVRRGDEVLFAGLLAQGQRRDFSGRRLELTLGAPNNVDATLNGKGVPNFPEGSSTAVLAGGRLQFTPIT